MTLSRPTILIVDDQEAHLYVRSRILRQAGFATLQARNGHECLDLVAKERPALVLLDMNLPDMRGSEVCRQIKQRAAATPIFVLHITASLVSAQDKAHALNDGADGYLIEPVEPEELLATVRSLLRLHQAEEQLRQVNSRFERAERAAKGFVFEADLISGQVVRSPNFTQITGYTPEDVPPTTVGWTNLIHPDDRAGLVDTDTLGEGRTSYTGEYRVRHQAGHYVWVQEHGLIERDATGRPVAIVGTTIDISERKTAEEALHQREALLNVVLQNIPASVYLLTTDQRYLYVNRHYERLANITNAEIQGKAISDMFGPETAAQLVVNDLLALAAQGPIELEEYAPQDGKLHTYRSLKTALLDPHGEPYALLGISTDITERKQAERNQQLLDTLSLLTAEINDEEALLWLVAEQVGEHLGGYRCGFADIDAQTGTSHLHRDWCAPGAASVAGSHRNEHFLAAELRQSLDNNEAVIVADVSQDLRTAAYAENWAVADIAAFAFAPILRAGEWRALFYVHHQQPHVWRDDEIQLLREVAARIWPTVERLRAEKIVRRSEERYRTLFETMDQGYCLFEMIFDGENRPLDYRFLEVNPVFAQQTGLENAVGKTARELVPNLEEHWFAIYGAVALTGEPRRFVQGSAAMGRWFEAYAFRVGDPESRKVGLLFNNITERKQAEDALRHSETRFRTLANTVPSIIWTAAPDGTITYVNDQWLHYCGLTPEENARAWPQLVLHPDDFERCVTQWSDALESGAEYEIEVRNRRYDGVYRWFITRATPLRTAEGQITSWFGVTTDIDDRKRAEQNQQFLSDLHVALHLLADPRQIQQTVVERLGQYLGASRCRFNGIDLATDRADRLAEWMAPGALPTTDIFPFSEYASPAYIAHAQAGQTLVIEDAPADERIDLAQALLRKYGAPATIRVPCLRNGQWVASLHVLQNEPRHWRPDEIQLVESVVRHFWPLVEKARAEQALRLSEASLRTLIDHASYALFITDGTGVYVEVNAAACTLSGYSRAELLGKRVEDLAPPTLRPNLDEVRQQQMEDNQFREFVLLRKDGTTVPIELSLQQLPDGRWEALVRDISLRHQAEADARFLVNLSEAIRLAEDPDHLLAQVTDQVGDYLAVGRAYFTQQESAQERGLIAYQYSPRLPSVPSAYHIAHDPPPLRRELVAGQTLVCHDAQHDPRTQALYASRYAPSQECAFIAVPVLRQGQLVATLSVTTAEPRRWQRRESELLETITERVWLAVEKLRLAAQVRASEEQLRQITNNLPGLISMVNEREEYLFANHHHQQWLGLEGQQAIGQPLRAVMGAAAYAHAQPFVQRALAGETVTFEQRLVTATDAPLDLMVTLVPRWVNQRVQGCYIMAMDITARKEAEEALQQSNAILHGVLESSDDAIFVRDLEGRYLLVNRAAAEQVQLTPEQLIGHRYDELFSASEAAAIRAEDHLVFVQGQSVTLEHASQHQGSPRYWHTLKMPLRQANGAIVGLISSARDITERKRDELHQQFLGQLFSHLRLLNNTATMFDQLVTRLGQHLAVTSCRLNAIDLAHAEFTVLQNWGGNGVNIDFVYPLAELAPPAIVAALQAGEMVVVNNTASDPRTAAVMAAYDDDHVAAFIGVPIFHRGEWQATLSVKDMGERHWRPDEVRLLETVASQFSALLEKVRAEEALRSSEERLRLALEAGNLAVFEYDAATNLVHRSASAQSIQGLGEYGKGGEMLPYIHPLDRGAFVRCMEAIAPDQASYECEYRLRRPDNSQQVWLLERGQGFFTAQGDVQRVVGAVMDISERKQREAEGRFLAELSEVMVHTQAADELLGKVARRLAEFLDATRCFFMESDPAQEAVIIQRNYYQPGLVSIAGVYPLADFDPQSLAAQAAGQTVVVHDTQSPPVQAVRNQSRYDLIGVRALVSAPLLRAGQWVATLVVIDNRPRLWSEAEVRLIEMVAERAWLAVENRRLLGESQELLAQLTAILDNIPVGLAIYDRECRYVRINPTLAQINGRAVADHLHRPVRALWPQEADLLEARIQRIFTTGEGIYNLEVSNPAGQHYLSSWYPVKIDEQVRYVGASMVDITEQKQIEERARESQRFLQSIADTTPNLLYLFDLHTQSNRYANRQMTTLLGYTPSEVQALGGQLLGQLMHPEDLAFLADHQQHLRQLQDDEVAVWEYRLRHKNGVWHWLDSRETVFARDVAGAPQVVLGAVQDITARKLAELELRKSEERYRQLADAMPQIVWRTQTNGVVDYLNHQWFHYTGLTAETSYADPNQAIHCDDRPAAFAAWQQAQLTKTAYEYEMRLRRQDGVYRWFLVRTVPVHNEAGEVTNWYGSSTDITDLKQAQEELQQLNATLEHRVQERTAELERSNRELDKFAYVASHDLKSPLRAIENLAHWVAEDAGTQLPDAARGHLTRLQGRVKRMERLLDDLLAYSRAGRYQYKLEKIDLNAILQDTVDLLAPPPAFQFTFDIQAPVYIGQRAPLETVLRNLLGNAVKHHQRPDGHVWVSVQDQGEQIELVVRDDGPGIAPKFHDKVFEMFQTLQPRDRVEGSGMGLAIVKKLIESLGGALSLESQEGAGATFRVLWPKK